MTKEPTITLPNGKRAKLHIVAESGDCECVGSVDEGVWGYTAPNGEHISLMFMKPTGETDGDQIDSETLVYGGDS